MSREVEYGIRITAKDELTAPAGRAETSVRKLDAAIEGATGRAVAFAPALKSTGSAAFSLSGALGALGAVGAGLLVFGAVAEVTRRFAGAMMDAAAAASEAEQAELRAIATIRLHGEFSDRQFEALKRNNAERQRQLGIDADLQAQMQGTLSAMGVQAGALDRATEAAIGLSRATGLGLTEASRAVAKALGGHVESLREYGIRVDSVAEAEARMADMFRASQAQSGTYGVAVSALSAAWGDLLEALGALITQNPQVMTTINAIIGGVESMTGSMSQGTKTAKGLGQIVTTTFRLIGTSAQATASLISTSIKALDFFWRSPNLMRLSKDLDKSIVEMENIMAGGTGREAENIAEQAGAEYLEAFKAAEFYRRELSNIDTTQEGAADAILATNRALAEQEAKLRALQDWASKSTAGMNGMIRAAEDLAQAEVDASRERNQPRIAQKTGAKGTGQQDQRRASEEADAEMMLEITEWVVKKRNAAIESGLEKEREARARVKMEAEKLEEAKLAAAKARIDAQQEAERKAGDEAAQHTDYVRGRIQQLGMQIVESLGNAFSIVGRLQNKTVTEIVRNDQGMLEERTRITEQYIATHGDALKKFFTDMAGIIYKAAIYELTAVVVSRAAGAFATEVSNKGLVGILTGLIAAGAIVSMISSAKSAMPPPPKFFTGGVVPGPMGAARLAVVEGGERVTSVADRVDGRGASGGSIVVHNNALVMPSRVQMERTNRDAIIPSLRRLQRLGYGT